MDQNGGPHDVRNFEQGAYSVTSYQQKYLFFLFDFFELLLSEMMCFGIVMCHNATYYVFSEHEACFGTLKNQQKWSNLAKKSPEING